jgi:adenylate cyclase
MQGPAIEGSIKLGPDVHRVVMGYAVNIAARLQNATKELNNNFIISDEVYRLLSIPPEKYQKRSIGLRGVSGRCRCTCWESRTLFNTSDPLP